MQKHIEYEEFLEVLVALSSKYFPVNLYLFCEEMSAPGSE
jgi:hypothetical protein